MRGWCRWEGAAVFNPNPKKNLIKAAVHCLSVVPGGRRGVTHAARSWLQWGLPPGGSGLERSAAVNVRCALS